MASTALATVGEDAATEHVPIKTTQLLVNAFITDTVAFLNSFSAITESKLQAMGGNIARLEKNLILLEHKLARIPGLTDIAEGQHAPPASTRLPTEHVEGSEPVASQAEPAAQPQPEASSSAGANAPPSAAEPAPAPAAAAEIPPEYIPYQRLIKMGMPQEQLALKMRAEGADPAVLGITDTEAAPASAPAPEPAPAPAAAAEVPPEYKSYQRLMKMGMPQEQLALKMRAEGADPAILGISE